jgi:hypothetical protein
VNANANDNAKMPTLTLMLMLRPLLKEILMIMLPLQRLRQMCEGDM